MTTKRIQTGRKGEHIAIAYLVQNGYTIITQNYQNRFGEIDIIAQEGDVIVFIEVKTRKDAPFFGPPQLAVSRAKQQKMVKTSCVYIKQRGVANQVRFRFDVMAVTLFSDGTVKEGGIVLIKNAFQARG